MLYVLFLRDVNVLVCRNVRTHAANVRTAEEEDKTGDVCAEVEETVIMLPVLCCGFCQIELSFVNDSILHAHVLQLRIFVGGPACQISAFLVSSYNKQLKVNVFIL